MMAILRVLSSAGDTSYEWDVASVRTGDAAAVAAVQEAERIFAEQRARGATAFRVWPGRPAERLDRFDPLAEQVVLVPRVAGG
jgi:Tfp pilus assembly protein PilE